MSCSSVPRSRSRTIAKAARRVPEKVSRIATRPGMRRLALRESGLKSRSGWVRIGRSFAWARSASSVTDLAKATPLAAARACAEIVESEPSIRTRTSAGSPFRRRRAYSGGISTPTEARPATMNSFKAGRDGHDVEVARVDEIVQELATLLGSALVKDDGADVFDVRVDQAEEDELEGGDEKGELEGAPVPDHLDRLLPQDRQEPSHEAALACSGISPRCSIWSRVRRTNTSSREASIGRIVTFAPEASSRSRAIFASATSARTSRWSALPKIVTSST